ncbi:autotransporter outer membrane beta-barrel domain-containing protein [Pseudomonas sp. UL073]|uniref:Autotransporter outer membrane beta-barrel domain-containing protein n=1 Tax=Zestomonas insulae TaxID=2809017 RepID=A0ABS2ICC3_9GAMM|nr:autotransporter outer membrane beta-barrel domain-containing protein [Pseudomonas insulae]MBM7060771.1 autotransporter outer membrane beta-barrel domain-containing protein [Pseudomonas insulae]
MKSTPLEQFRRNKLAQAVALSGATLLVVFGTTLSHAATINAGQIVTVPGSHSTPWSFPDSLTVGDTSSGTLIITSGGSVSSGSGFIGRRISGTGMVTVSGAGSEFTSGPGLSVGFDGNGTLAILDGGHVTSTTNSYIGVSLNSIGLATVSGVDSQWNTNGLLRVGQTGNGTLEITDGGVVSNTQGYVGYETAGTGTVSVNGPGSRWNNSSDLSVGTSGIGTLNITNSGSVSDTAGMIGSTANGRGAVTVDGAGSAWTNSSTLTVGNLGNGALTLSNDGTASAVSATVAANSGSRGVINIGAAATAPAAAPGKLILTGPTPTLTLGDAGSLVFNHTDNSGSYAFTPVITGPGKLATYSGTTVLTGDNSYTGGTHISAGTLQLGNGGTTGSIVGNVTNNGTLAFKRSNTMTVGGAISGSGAVQQLGTGTTMLTGTNTYTGGTAIHNGTLAVANSAIDSMNNLGSGGVHLAAGATLDAHTTGAFTFSNALTGSGVLNASNGNQAFSFTTGAGSGFSGTVALSDNTFDLSGSNTTALTHATLRTDSGNVTTVGDGEQQIGGLTFNGGTVKFNARLPDQQLASSTITTNTLDTIGTGTVSITVPQPYVPSAPDTPNARNLLVQDDANIGTQLVNAASTIGTAGAIVLVDQDGHAVSDARLVDIAQGGDTVAKATYDYRLSTAPGDGLYVNYGLKQLDLQAGQSLTLAEDTGATGAAADMSAKITGSGNLAIDAGAGLVSLSNTSNDYSGDTTVTTGMLRTDADHALGQTDTLHIASTAAVGLNGTTQTIQQLDGQAGSTLNIDGGALTIASGGTSAGSLSGSGQFNLNGGVLDVQGPNAALSASTSIAAGASARLNDTLGLGTGAIADEGTLELDGASGTLANALSGMGEVNLVNGANVTVTGDNDAFEGQFATAAGTTLTVAEAKHLGQAKVADAGTLVVNATTDWTLGNAVSGSGDLIKQGNGTLTAGDALSYTGKSAVDAGTLIVGDTTRPNVTLGAAGAGEVRVAQGATLAGLGTVSGQVANAGTVAALNALAGHSADPAGTFTLGNGMLNSGTVNLAGSEVGNVLVVMGDYVGNDGKVVINTVMGGDTSSTDKLLIDGGRASGNTGLVVKHAGGEGAQTTHGIRVVETRNGGTTDASAFALDATSDGYRQGVGSLAAGPYDYRLARGGNGGVADDWYLVSQGADQPTDDCTSSPALCPTPTPSFRPEVGSYLNNKLAASTMQFHTLHERQSQAPGLVGKNLQESSDANAWIRVVGKTSSREGALSASDTQSMVHLGSDILRFSDGGEGSIRVGAMGAYGRSSNRADNGALSSRGTVDGYSLGAYATWYGHRDIQSGPYADSWVMYGKFDNKVSGQGLPTERYQSNNLATSLETGYSLPIHETESMRMYLEPQGQVIVSKFHADNHTERNGTVVSGQADTSVTTRLGVRLHGLALDDTDMKQIRPFAEVNWWHGPGSQTVTFDDIVVRDGLPTNWLEGKIGLQGNVTKAVSLWGSVGIESGDHEYTAGEAQIGVKYSW